MTNYEHITTLPVDKFSDEIISLVSRFGGNKELILHFLNSAYYNPHPTLRDILKDNFSGSLITFRYGGIIYECVSVDDFIQKYGTKFESILNSYVTKIQTGKNGNKTVSVL